MTDSLSQGDEDEGDTDSEATENHSDDDCSSTSLSSAELAAPAFSSGGTPSTSLRHRITNKARLQKDEQILERTDGYLKVPSRPMMELEAGSNVWYQAYVLKESKTEVKVRFPAIEPSDEEKMEWVRKGSSRIWHGSYKASQWRHLGKGAWAPRAKPKMATRRLGGRARRKQSKRQSRACGEGSAYTDNSVQCTRTSQGLGKDDVSHQQDNEIMSPAPKPVRHQDLKSQDHKSYISHTMEVKMGAEVCIDLNTIAADSNKDNSSKPLSSEDVHGQFKGSGVQGDQISAKSNSSDFKGMFFESDHDVEQEDRLADSAEYDPLAKWFEMHFQALSDAGTLAYLPYGPPEAGVLPAGFAYDSSSKQVLGSAPRSRRTMRDNQELAQQQCNAVAHCSEQQDFGVRAAAMGTGAAYEDSWQKPQLESELGWGDNSKQDSNAGANGVQHRSRGLRELQGLSMWGWDHNDHSSHEFADLNPKPSKRLRGHVGLGQQPGSNTTSPTAQPSSMPAINAPPPSNSPPSPRPNSLQPIDPCLLPGSAAPMDKPASPPLTSISRHHSCSNSKQLPVVDEPPTTPSPPTIPSTSAPVPALHPLKLAAAPPQDAARRQRKRAIIVSDDEDDNCPAQPCNCPGPSLVQLAPIAACPTGPSSKAKQPCSDSGCSTPVAVQVRPPKNAASVAHNAAQCSKQASGSWVGDSLQQRGGAKRKAADNGLAALAGQKAAAGGAVRLLNASGAKRLVEDVVGLGPNSANGKMRNGLKWGAARGQEPHAAGRLGKVAPGKNGTGNHVHGNGSVPPRANVKSNSSYHAPLHRV